MLAILYQSPHLSISSVDYLINVLKVRLLVFSKQFSGKAWRLKLRLSWHIIQVVQLLKIFQGLHLDCFLANVMFLQIILVRSVNIYIKFCWIFLCNTGSPNSIPNSCSNLVILSREWFLRKPGKHQSWKQWSCRLCWKLPDRAQFFIFCSQIITE